MRATGISSTTRRGAIHRSAQHDELRGVLQPVGLHERAGGSGTDHLSFATWISNNEKDGWPASKLTMGFATSGDACGASYGCWAMYNYDTLGTLGGPATSSSIPVSALSAAIPAGNIVLATNEKYPAHQEIVTTSGAAAGATSIPLTGNPTLNYAYGSGNLVAERLSGTSGVRARRRVRASRGLAGTAYWDARDEYGHYGATPCLNAIASAVTSPNRPR